VLRGEADPALLDTYTAERAPVGRQIVDRANLSRDQFLPIFETLGIAGGGDDEAITLGMKALDAPDADGAARRARMAEAIELKNFEFNAHGVEMNQRYESTAVIPDGSPAEVFRKDKELYVQATTRPGARLPHVWLVGADGHRLSTLDLVGHGRFTLLTGISGAAWVDAAAALPVTVTRIGVDGLRDAYGDWLRAREIEEDGALLVRPDGYLAWRAARLPEDPTAALTRAYNSVVRPTSVRR
jgi:2,4-dichlorophenol 6-monooxygenase